MLPVSIYPVSNLSDPEAAVMLHASKPLALLQRLSFVFMQQEALLRIETTL